MVRKHGRVLVMLCAVLSASTACNTAPTGADGGRSSVEDDAAAMSAEGVLELGTGATSFERVGDGHTLGLVRGIQGLQHIWISLRVRGVDPEVAITRLTLTRERDGAVVNEPFRARLAYAPGADWAELTGVRLITPDERAVFGEALILHAHVEDRDSAWAEAEASVLVVPENEL